MSPVASPTELTSAATDLLLGVVSLIAAGTLLARRARDPVRAGIWGGVFLLLAGASILGAAVHGFEIPRATKDLIWAGIYLALGFVVALFLAGAVLDRWGTASARRALPLVLAVAVVFFAFTRLARGTFLVFIAYEAAAMLFALAVYGGLARRRAPGAGWITAGIALSIAAAAVQSARGVAITVVWPFDHNGLFHLVQTAGVILLARGLTVPHRGRAGTRAKPIVVIAGVASLAIAVTAPLAGADGNVADPAPGDPASGRSPRALHHSPYAFGASLGLPQIVAFTAERRVAPILRVQANAGTLVAASSFSARALVLPDRWRVQPYLFAGLGFFEILLSDDDWQGFTSYAWMGYGLRLRASQVTVFGELGFIPCFGDRHAGDDLVGVAGGVLFAIGD